MKIMKKKNFKEFTKILCLIFVILITFNVYRINFNYRSDFSELNATSTFFEEFQVQISNWDLNGNEICTESNDQLYPQICSDGAGGAIIVWQDNRSGNDYDIYAQRINSSGDILWSLNGVPICTELNWQEYPKIISDGAGGAIIVWQDKRHGGGWGDIYAQRINSTGDPQWDANGTAICWIDSDNQFFPNLCSDGEGGAIIMWSDMRNGTHYNIYAQRINITGDTQWDNNGIAVCTKTNIVSFYVWDQDLHIISDDNNGCVVLWRDRRSGIVWDLYTQRINSTGHMLWNDNGTVICNIPQDHKKGPRLCSDGTGGAIINWYDGRYLGNTVVFAQRINGSGITQWTPNGTLIFSGTFDYIDPRIISDGIGGAIITASSSDNITTTRINSNGQKIWTPSNIDICNAEDKQISPQIISDGAGGAIIAWEDRRSGALYDIHEKDIYIQRINSTGGIKWINNGIPIVTEPEKQWYFQLCTDGSGGAFICWQDNRTGTDYDIYAMHKQHNDIPYSNHPGSINTTPTGTEIIQWIIYDDSLNGQYRIFVNDTLGIYYLYNDWTEWNNGIPINISINRTVSGIFKYIFEYKDNDDTYGALDTVNVIVDANPTSNHPNDIITTLAGSETINWTLYDDLGGGQYRVLANDTDGNIYVWKDWTPWVNNAVISIPINRTQIGIYNYTIGYFDNSDNSGIPDTVKVTIQASIEDGGFVISFGNYYLIFIGFSIISLIIIKKRKFLRRIK